nr:hypothetical protein [Kibdelosporangium sp. MJ126-NF4]CTQ89334.1 hypothetical protein [Kibdelosporangium sp. MJ126-NF4]
MWERALKRDDRRHQPSLGGRVVRNEGHLGCSQCTEGHIGCTSRHHGYG